MEVKHGVAPAGAEGGVKHQQPDDTFSESSTYDSQSKNEGDFFDRLSTDESESEDEIYSWELDTIFEGAYQNFLEFIGSCEIANDEYKKNWKYMTQESKKRAMEKYALLEMKMMEVYNGLPDPEDDSAQGEEKSVVEMSEGE